MGDLAYNAGYWIGEHRVEIALCTALTLFAIAFTWLVLRTQAEYQEQIALCVRAFEYSRDQCEFIVRNHVMVSR